MKYISDIPKNRFSDKVCLLRLDLNIEKGQEKSAWRVMASLPTLNFLIRNGSRIVILSHRGRPEKKSKIQFKIKNFNKEFTLRPFAGVLSEKLRQKVIFINNFNFGKIKNEIGRSRPGSVFLLENLRFLRSEEKNDSALAKKLAALGDFYVNDAFAVSHRKDASVVAIVKYLPSYGGFLLKSEIKYLGQARNFKSPTLILGGAKIVDKVAEAAGVVKKARFVLLGSSFFDSLSSAKGRRILRNKKIIPPEDTLKFRGRSYDIGSKTIKKYEEIIKNSKAIIWSGPVGFSEKPRFAKGSRAIVQAILRNNRAFVVVGGGETTSLFVLKPKIYNPKPNIFLSTGGGAMLAFLSGQKLPALEALKR